MRNADLLALVMLTFLLFSNHLQYAQALLAVSVVALSIRTV